MHSIVPDGPDRLPLRGDAKLRFAGYPLIALGVVIVGFGVAALSTGFGAFLERALVGVVVAGVGSGTTSCTDRRADRRLTTGR